MSHLRLIRVSLEMARGNILRLLFSFRQAFVVSSTTEVVFWFPPLVKLVMQMLYSVSHSPSFLILLAAHTSNVLQIYIHTLGNVTLGITTLFSALGASLAGCLVSLYG